MRTSAEDGTGNKGIGGDSDMGSSGSYRKDDAGDRRPLNILLVEDNLPDQELVAQYLRDIRGPRTAAPQLTRCGLLANAVDHLKHHTPDIVLLDLNLPDARGLSALDEVIAVAPTVPIVVLTGLDDEQVSTEALKVGAQDYIPKNDLSSPLLARTLRYAIERKKLEEGLRQQARYDTLTGLANRAQFHERLQEAIAHAKRLRDHCGVLVIDLDGFKMVNDSLGHDAGDAVLIEAAERLRRSTRETDLVARLGGDEFAVIANHLPDTKAAALVARNIAEALSRRFPIDGLRTPVSASVGVTVYPDDRSAPEELVTHADQAMYEAKAAGPGQFSIYRPFGGESRGNIRDIAARESLDRLASS